MWIIRIVALLAALGAISLGTWIRMRSGIVHDVPSPLPREAQPAVALLDQQPDKREPPRPFIWRPAGTAPAPMRSAPAAGVEGFHFERFIVSPIDLPPAQVVVGDVTGDRRNDVVVIQDHWSLDDDPRIRVRIHVQNANGTLAPPLEYEIVIEIGGISGSVELADMESDGRLEIVVGADRGLTIFRQAPGGFFRRSYSGTVLAQSLAVVDADGDGVQDIVAQSWNEGADIYLGGGHGGVRSVQHMSTPPIGYNTLEASDFTADGFDDLVMTNGQGWPKAWIYPFTWGGLADPITIDLTSVVSSVVSGMTVADVDRDGRPDLVVADEGSDIAPKGIHVLYRGTGNQFADEVFLPFTGAYDRPGAVRVADVDGNGDPDIVTMLNSNDGMAYFLQGPSGFADPVILRTDDNPWTNNAYWDNSFAIADVNSDRCPDVVLAEASSSLRVFYGRGCQVAARKTGGPLLPGRL